eukprot:CAMPEP_0202471814 /NCGR_PEP_ID=MMETSP1360-20130828/85800_1 /ASSEMBLY_ACC=CAM_ASM_000848 /TAXON_ID=515479 /ORGANISM="Licmophora paradoxa, Strain CCMP2313" /LENGTH=71 /DNA_ID=CAMNT_0049098047 /DNA_START=9 /DNA_END=221 /DNA_ORIENTATION=+
MTEYEEMDDQQTALWIATGKGENSPEDPCMQCSNSPTYIPPDLLQRTPPESEEEEVAQQKPEMLATQHPTN